MMVTIPVVLIAGAGLVGLAWRASGHAVHPAATHQEWGLDDYPSLVADEVQIAGRDVTLSGRFFAGRNGATIVLSHGYGGSQDEMLPVTAALHGAGFGVFTYDLRGCGRSGGAVTFGTKEQDDLVSVVDHLATRRDVDPARIGALGFSMGGAVTIMAAAKDTRIRAIVADSAWSEAKSWLKPSIRATFLNPRNRFSALSLKLAELRTGADLDRLRPVDAIRDLNPRSVLIIHGAADDVVSPEDGARNFAAAGTHKQLWRVPGATHGATIRPNGITSTRRVAEFFELALKE
jgi:pimeloyl-ACP methyl ester carboxylesterase